MEALSLQHITKTYPGVTALDDVSISFEEGEVHAIVGENGAGKSTFIKVISGAIRPDSGEVHIGGRSYAGLSPSEAKRLGVAVVYQELIQFDAMSVADNIFMGMREEGGIVIRDRERYARTQEYLAQFGCRVRASDLIRTLSIANRQIIEIIKAVVQKASVVIMDEPTAAITVEEQKHLFDIIRELKRNKVTVIYISHRLEELFEICDRVTVLRDGKYVDTLAIGDTDKQGLIRLMVGRALSETYPMHGNAIGDEVLRTERLCGNGLTDISFTLHKGEILGFAGLVGAGRTELMHLIFGAAKKTSGKIYLKGREKRLDSPGDGLAAGIGIIPEDRKGQGCFLEKPVYWNISISNLDQISRATVIDSRKEMRQAEKFRDAMRIKTPTLRQLALNLSGGNQQKVVVAKVLAIQPEILIFDEPTRGIDVGARYEIYTMMMELVEQGKSILMVSSDMEELLGMSDRIIVLHEGAQVGTLEKDAFDQETILRLASGM